MTPELTIKIVTLAKQLQAMGWRMGTAESCTAGGIAYHLTEQAGASSWFAGGAVVYQNELKQSLLGVNAKDLQTYGAVSESVAAQMAQGAIRVLDVDCAIAVSGVAGPGGGTADKPVGCVWLAWAWRDAAGVVHVRTHRAQYAGNRSEVRMQTILDAIDGLVLLSAQTQRQLLVPADVLGLRVQRWI